MLQLDGILLIFIPWNLIGSSPRFSFHFIGSICIVLGFIWVALEKVIFKTLRHAISKSYLSNYSQKKHARHIEIQKIQIKLSQFQCNFFSSRSSTRNKLKASYSFSFWSDDKDAGDVHGPARDTGVAAGAALVNVDVRRVQWRQTVSADPLD